MSKFRHTEDFDFDYIDDFKEENHQQNLQNRKRREEVKRKNKRRLEYIKEWDDLNG